MRDIEIKPRVDSNNVLVLYHYFEKDQSYIDNFAHFLRFGYDSSLNYLIIVAGEYSIELPALDNIEYLFTENRNFDYGGYCAAIKNLNLWQRYDFYFFINSSVRGPFLLGHCNQKWTKLFIENFSNDVGIVGSVISTTPCEHSIAKMYYKKYGVLDRNEQFLGHVQTTCYVLSRDVLSQLIEDGFYEGFDELSKDETVRDYEIRLSQLILDMGLNLRCMLPEYNQIDYRETLVDINPTSREGDSGFEGSYFGRSAHPYEAIFIKTSRNTFSDGDLQRFAFSMSARNAANISLVRQSLFSAYIQKIQSCALNVDTKTKPYRKKSLKSFFKGFK
ncbi:hypothetical protein FD975_01320 [Polynucleobacter sp. AP-Jannik-300A-C4]|uniref:hypothetical protein n=1 Tax=Polynucleobacter sp. AP-Jannik-300A-C4 TaxID=2576928 RepID=UPI001BFDEE1F|nr:hypothetical protein [Polynucleobacter sp. AP-Jannik-300A-C4]QWE22876.1 hypothetical protein FD975_01320 [Polynucleobacter sp. AP-Jannik-300A-C4]